MLCLVETGPPEHWLLAPMPTSSACGLFWGLAYMSLAATADPRQAGRLR